jgi:hypothetical protein
MYTVSLVIPRNMASAIQGAAAAVTVEECCLSLTVSKTSRIRKTFEGEFAP